MIEKFTRRENRIFEILHKFTDAELDFFVVGGYAVSAYKHRFSIDADLVIKKDDFSIFKEILEDEGFKRTTIKELGHVYAPVFMRYESKEELPVSIDLLLGAVAVRQTGAAFGFELLRKHSSKRKIIGNEKDVDALVPMKELLIALKLHSGRLTDLRDIVALCKDIDIGFIKRVTSIGEQKILMKHVDVLFALLEKKDFVDSFKGVFMEKKYDIDLDCVRRLCRVLKQRKSMFGALKGIKEKFVREK